MRIGSWWYIGVVLIATMATPAQAQSPVVPQLALAPRPQPLGELVSVSSVELRGVVLDEQGEPLPGAVVSALGGTSAFAVSDADGRFTVRDLRPGAYLVRAYLRGYLQARGRIVQVSSSESSSSTIALTRRPSAADAPAVLAAGVGASGNAPPEARQAEDQDQHQHTEVAWRLRRQKRSVLKGVSDLAIELEDDGSLFEAPMVGLGRANGSPASAASAVLADSPVTGQINLLTTASFDRPQDLFTLTSAAPRGVAYLALAAPGLDGDWAIRGTVTQGDLASWILAGSYARRQPAAHAYEAGLSFGMQRYLGGNTEALSAIRDGGRHVAEMYAFDDWTLSPRLSLGYGAKYARYDYLADRGLLSPRASMTLQPSADDNLRVRATVSHREVAPGAEEFLPPTVGLWLPPERTFSQVSRGAFEPETHDRVEVAMEREWFGQVLVGVRAFRERVEDQVVTVFGAAGEVGNSEIGHYQVGSAGDYEASGWGVSVNRAVGDHLKASVDYSQSQAAWSGRSADTRMLARLAASVLRGDERIHDLTAAVESFVESTATRVFVVYRLNSALSASDASALSTTGARFDVQVNQSLPFMNFTSTQWEMLVAVSNLFKDELFEGSIYDEILVVRPPTRVLGGVTVRF
jgi:hypothetical protein